MSLDQIIANTIVSNSPVIEEKKKCNKKMMKEWNHRDLDKLAKAVSKVAKEKVEFDDFDMSDYPLFIPTDGEDETEYYVDEKGQVYVNDDRRTQKKIGKVDKKLLVDLFEESGDEDGEVVEEMRDALTAADFKKEIKKVIDALESLDFIVHTKSPNSEISTGLSELQFKDLRKVTRFLLPRFQKMK